MKRTQVLGLLLWRGGLLVVAAAILFEAARLFLRFIKLPVQIEIGLGLGIAGAALVFVSLVLERLQDLRSEGNLRE